jgi:hypothetical protein
MTLVQKRIVPMNERADYLRARELTKNKGGLPPNVLHDYYLVKTDKWESMKRNLYPAWAREILAYPEYDGKFKKGKDVIDSRKDYKGRRWVLPASYVPEEAIEREKVGLFIDPEDVVVEGDNVIVHPKTIVVLHPLGSGIMDPETAVPLEMGSGVSENFPDGETRRLYKVEGVGVWPLVRDYLALLPHLQERDMRNAVIGRYHSYCPMHVAYVEDG